MSENLFSLTAPVFKEEKSPGEYGYDLRWQDYRNWLSADEDLPEIHLEHFPTKQAALARKSLVRNVDGIVACVTATPAPKSKPKAPKKFVSKLHLTA